MEMFSEMLCCASKVTDQLVFTGCRNLEKSSAAHEEIGHGKVLH